MNEYQTGALKRHFARMGAALQVNPSDSALGEARYQVDVIAGRRQGQEVFSLSLAHPEAVEFLVLQVDPGDRHLLLLVRQGSAGAVTKHRYLCGHDERSWFVAVVPGPATTIERAKEALKPREAIDAQARAGVERRHRQRRHNKGYLRQGEWFFIPVPRLVVSGTVLRDEPISRGAGKPHRVELVCRQGGTTVYVSRQHPSGVTRETYERLLRTDPSTRARDWRVMRRDAEVYGRGRVSHPDHATLHLPDWHRVLPNTESRAPGIAHLTFLD